MALTRFPMKTVDLKRDLQLMSNNARANPLVQLPQEFFLGSIDTYRVPIYCIEECLPSSSLLDQLLCERLDRPRHMELFYSRIAEVNPTGIELPA